MDERHADERHRVALAARLRAVEEARVLADVRDDLRAAGLRDEARDPLADAVAPERALLGVERARRGLDAQLVARQQRDRPAHHPEPLLGDLEHLRQELADVALARDGGGDVAQQRHGEGFVVFHGARILAVPPRARKHFLTKMERFDRN